MREWRKVGEGTLVLAGSRQNEIFLNLGGTGTTRLEQKDGYAAYSVLANTGSKVVLEDVGQIAAHFTSGNGGSVLNFNGIKDWQEGTHFDIHALTQDAVFTNKTGHHRRCPGIHPRVRYGANSGTGYMHTFPAGSGRSCYPPQKTLKQLCLSASTPGFISPAVKDECISHIGGGNKLMFVVVGARDFSPEITVLPIGTEVPCSDRVPPQIPIC